ncbi:MAG: hypothetical protein OJF49_004309 [Ktedonobacterales bacterium]|nr:MAG: hypothetical protein OJF49_004309 [Ktedonobacterales bacterium]
MVDVVRSLGTKLASYYVESCRPVRWYAFCDQPVRETRGRRLAREAPCDVDHRRLCG